MRIDYTRAAAAIVVAISCAGALGQVQVQQNNPLDANPQVGSGGSNQPVQGYVPVNGNDIVTGNVSGLKYFHQPTSTVVAGPGGSLIVVPSSSLGTFSPYAFQGSLGSSSFNNFARQSAGGSQTNIGATRTFYLPSSTVSTGQGSLYSAPYGGGYESALIPRYSAAATTTAGDVGQMNGSLSYGIPIHQFSATPANVGASRRGSVAQCGEFEEPAVWNKAESVIGGFEHAGQWLDSRCPEEWQRYGCREYGQWHWRSHQQADGPVGVGSSDRRDRRRHFSARARPER